MKYEMLASPMNIGSCQIKNRVVMPPMMLGFGQFNGCPTEKMMNYYEERAKGGCGLIITEITRVNDCTGASSFNQLAVSHDYHIEPLREMAKRIQRHGAKFFVQLHHPGRQNVGLLVGTVPLSISMQKATRGIYGKALFKLTPKVGPLMIDHKIVPCSVAPSKCEPAYFAGGRVRGLHLSEIKNLEKQFIDGAERVFKAGCDGVELHAAHGYLIQQFLSPVTNHRTDEYGGCLENRMRFLLNILNGIKTRCGKDFPVIVRLSADECYSYIGHPEKGYNLDEGVKMAKIIEQNGADAIDVSSAGYDTFNYWLEPVSFKPGWRKYMAQAVKNKVKIPVLAANLIRSPAQAEQQLEDGIQDFVSLGRPHIADPNWTNKALSGNEKKIRRCISCLTCFETMQKNAYIGQHGECAVNPLLGHEGEELPKDGHRKKILVCGAGPAGLMAANVLAQRDFDVTLIEKDSQPGGQILLAAAPPDKEKTAWLIEDSVEACINAGAEIRLNTPLSKEILDEIRPYAVLISAGSSPVKPKFNGNGKTENLYTFADILNGNADIKNKKVALIGSGMTGLETAHALVENGCKVTIVEMASEIAPGTWMQHLDDIIPHLKEAGTKFITSEKLCEVNDGYIITEHVKSHNRRKVDCDCVVLALGSRPNSKVKKIAEDAGYNPISIGDCDHIGRICDATKAAYKIASNLN